MIVNQERFVEIIDGLLNQPDLDKVKVGVRQIKDGVETFKTDKLGLLNIVANGGTVKVDKKYLFGELEQIIETRTLERTRYYLSRLKKALTSIKTSKINDLNLNRWKEYEDIITDSLWVIERRDSSGGHNGGYWGNFIPQIPNQMLRRYTKAGEWALDPFLGSGTTLIECKRLGRNGIGIELQPKVAKLAKDNVRNETNLFSQEVRTDVHVGDSASIDGKKLLTEAGIQNIQFIILHPPYWDIIRFSEDERDLSTITTIEGFLTGFGKIIDNISPLLAPGRYCALVIGDKYSGGEWIPLGFYTMQEMLKRGYKLKSTIVKNFDETKGKLNQKELWRYRALVGGFYIFKHEYIFLFQSKK